MNDDFIPLTEYAPRITLPGFEWYGADRPRAPGEPVADIFDMPVSQRVLLDPITGKPSGGFTRTGVYLTVVR